MPKPSKHALAVLTNSSLAVAQEQLKRLQEATIAELANIARREAETGMRAIMAGIALHRIKLSLKHGEWMPWIDKQVPVKKSQVNNYMRLAIVFLERTKADKPELLALPGDQLSLEVGDNAVARALIAKLVHFCGDCSLTELLIKHGIKAVGLKTTLQAGDEDGDDDLTPEQRAAELREQTWKQAWNATQQLRATLTEPDKISLINDPKHVEQLKAEVVELNALLDERLAALRAVAV